MYGTHPADEANMTTLRNKEKKAFFHEGFREENQETESNSMEVRNSHKGDYRGLCSARISDYLDSPLAKLIGKERL